MTFNPVSTARFAVPAKLRIGSTTPAEGPRLSPTTARGGAAKRRLYRQLLGDILQGRLAPDRTLCMRELARDYGTSTTSVRQVLIELVRDHLVIGSAAGYKIAPASQTELLDLTQTAYWLADLGVRESIRRGDRQWEENVLRTYRAVDVASEPKAALEPGAPHWEQMLALYDALVSACHSSILAEQCRSLNERLLRYRNLAIAETGRDHQHRAAALALRDAALARDADLASELLRSHFRETEHGILASGILT